jgi:hypothetical protein
MGKTIKDKANYFAHHMAHDNPFYIQKPGKHKIPADEIPKDLKPMIDKLNYGYNNGLRHGNNRNMYSEAKVIDRRAKRAQDKVETRKELQEI